MSIKSKKDDFYINMLRFGKQKMSSGFTLQDLVAHMIKQGFEKEVGSAYSTLLKEYSTSTLVSNSAKPFPDESAFYFLTSEAYFNLLHYDSIRSTKNLAIWAIIISVVLAIASFLGPILYSKYTVKANPRSVARFAEVQQKIFSKNLASSADFRNN